MGYTRNKDKATKWRSLLGVIAIVCVLLSSCAIKSNIKGWLSFERTTERSATSNSTKSGKGEFVSCQQNLSAGSYAMQKSPVKFLGALIPATQFSFVGFNPFSERQLHFFYNSVQIMGSLPIFLRYRQLII